MDIQSCCSSLSKRCEADEKAYFDMLIGKNSGSTAVLEVNS